MSHDEALATDLSQIESGPRWPSLTRQKGTLAEHFDPRSNSLTVVRWGLALCVVVSHSFPLGGYHRGIEPFYVFSGPAHETLGGLAVAGFFVLSGFLITRSYKSSKNVGWFLWKRFLRIMPAFWLSLLIVAFILGPVAWIHQHHHFADYFAKAATSPWHYVKVNFFLTMHEWSIRDLLVDTPFAMSGNPAAWNGSLWTLIFEARCYLILGAFGFFGLLRHRWTVVAFTGLLYFVTVISATTAPYSPTNPAGTMQTLADWIPNAQASFFFLFFLGSCCALFANELVLDDRMGIGALIGAVLFLHYGGWFEIGLPLFAYFLIWFGTRVKYSVFERFGDPSYGTYVMAFPIQMMLAEFGLSNLGRWTGIGGGLTYITVSLVLSGAVGYLSWHLLEKHALRLKNGIPRKARKRQSPHADAVVAPGRPHAGQALESG